MKVFKAESGCFSNKLNIVDDMTKNETVIFNGDI